MEAFQLDCVQSDVHWMCMMAVQLSLLDLRMMEGALQFGISEVLDFEKWKTASEQKPKIMCGSQKLRVFLSDVWSL